MNNKQKLQAIYFDGNDLLTVRHRMTKTWSHSIPGFIRKCCCDCNRQITIDVHGRIGGNLTNVCRPASEQLFADGSQQTDRKGTQLTLL